MHVFFFFSECVEFESRAHLEEAFGAGVSSLPDGALKTELESRLSKHLKKVKG